MSNEPLKLSPRAEELLVDQVTSGLTDECERELGDLLRDNPEQLQAELMATAALVQLSFLSTDQRALTPMPQDLRDKILAAAPTTTAAVVDIAAARPATNRSQTGATAPAARRQLHSFVGWAVAASLAVALVIVNTDNATPDAATQRAALITAANDLVVAPWAQPETAEFTQVTGDVVWSDQQQQGYMRLAGMPANNPSDTQYQLWIVDPDRSAQPVDGGVFDIPPGAGEFIIPINAKLAVRNPAAFAITMEKPGGVVVSAGPLLVVAPTET